MSYSPVTEGLKRASTKDDVKDLINSYGYPAVNDAWKDLSSVDRGALSLLRSFEGSTIIREFDDDLTI